MSAIPHHIERGEGPAVVFLHGIGGDAESWLPELQALAGDYRAIAWDEAIERLSKAVGIHPGHAEAHYNLGVALYNRGSYTEAWNEVQLAARLGFDPPEEIIRLLREKLAEPRSYQQE